MGGQVRGLASVGALPSPRWRGEGGRRSDEGLRDLAQISPDQADAITPKGGAAPHAALARHLLAACGEKVACDAGSAP